MSCQTWNDPGLIQSCGIGPGKIVTEKLSVTERKQKIGGSKLTTTLASSIAGIGEIQIDTISAMDKLDIQFDNIGICIDVRQVNRGRYVGLAAP